MDFLENAISKAKEAMEIVGQKTEEVVSTQKNRFDVASIKNKRSKDFEKLGELYFNLNKDAEIENPDIKEIVEEIKDKNKRISEIKKEINSSANKKVCPKCSALIEKEASFCSSCGIKLD